MTNQNLIIKLELKTKSHDLSLRANYTDRTTAAFSEDSANL
jgi:hypothetical protein